MTDLSPEAKALVDLARADDEPTEADRARVRGALGASVATALVMGSTTSVAASATAKAAALGVGVGLGGAAKIAMWVGVGMALGAATTGVIVVATQSPADKPRPAATSPSRTSDRTPRAAADDVNAPAEAPSSTTTIPLEVTSKPAAVKPSPTAPSSLPVEMHLLATARAALSAGDARRALSLLEEHERDFPSGVLAEERRASKVFALCELGRRADAARAAMEFLRTAPSSPLRGRVLDSCAFGQ